MNKETQRLIRILALYGASQSRMPTQSHYLGILDISVSDEDAEFVESYIDKRIELKVAEIMRKATMGK